MELEESDGGPAAAAHQASDDVGLLDPVSNRPALDGSDSDPYSGPGPDPDSDPDFGPGRRRGDGSGSASGRIRRPTSVLGWAALPFVAGWRFLFPKKPRPFIVELPFLVVFALCLAFLIKTFLVQAFFIPSSSMQNTLMIGDRVMVNRAAEWIGDQPSRGQVIVFQDPGGWLDGEGPAPTSGNWLSHALSYVGILPQDHGDLVKRVIGVGGDQVICCNAKDQITVNGVPLDETYLPPGEKSDDGPGDLDPRFNITVPQGYLWVMGDNRAVSEDSRAHVSTDGGFVPLGDVVGRADLVIWPMSHWATLPVPDTFHQAQLSAMGALAGPGGTPAAAFALVLPLAGRRRNWGRKLAQRSRLRPGRRRRR